MSGQLAQHELTEKFFDLSLLFALDMQGKDNPSLLFQGQGNILLALDEKASMSQRELAEKLQISPPTITEFVNKLVKKDLVTKTRSQKDKRVVIVSLTGAGKHAVAAVDHSDLSGWQYLSPQQQAQMATLMEIIIHGLTQKYSDPTSKQILASMRRQFFKLVLSEPDN
ncbi:MarR family winged helix-turn-helix transcriptional regulator [Lentilactobacillus kisonensis]|nr:MarR family transcriptional regulator [Lentilactobacillus kisonensis]